VNEVTCPAESAIIGAGQEMDPADGRNQQEGMT